MKVLDLQKQNNMSFIKEIRDLLIPDIPVKGYYP